MLATGRYARLCLCRQSLGHVVSEPLWDDGNKKVVMEYVDGDACATFPHLTMTATIIFTCQPGPDKASHFRQLASSVNTQKYSIFK